MLERLTSQARKTMDRAYREARRFHHDYVGSEHVLLALMGDDSGFIAKALARMGRNAQGIYTDVSQTVDPGERPVDNLQLPLTPGVKRSLTYAAEEAGSQKLSLIGPEHLLLGLFRDESGQACRLLESLSLYADVLRNAMAAAGADNNPERQVRPDEPLRHAAAVPGPTDLRRRLAEEVIPQDWDRRKSPLESQTLLKMPPPLDFPAIRKLQLALGGILGVVFSWCAFSDSAVSRVCFGLVFVFVAATRSAWLGFITCLAAGIYLALLIPEAMPNVSSGWHISIGLALIAVWAFLGSLLGDYWRKPAPAKRRDCGER
ncbi:MAG: hypothetical protein HY040_01260 [Planctomycetes bacterium]|nr:hypothetical protein [Planctomycetota bacterium]